MSLLEGARPPPLYREQVRSLLLSHVGPLLGYGVAELVNQGCCACYPPPGLCLFSSTLLSSPYAAPAFRLWLPGGPTLLEWFVLPPLFLGREGVTASLLQLSRFGAGLASPLLLSGRRGKWPP